MFFFRVGGTIRVNLAKIFRFFFALWILASMFAPVVARLHNAVTVRDALDTPKCETVLLLAGITSQTLGISHTLLRLAFSCILIVTANAITVYRGLTVGIVDAFMAPVIIHTSRDSALIIWVTVIVDNARCWELPTHHVMILVSFDC